MYIRTNAFKKVGLYMSNVYNSGSIKSGAVLPVVPFASGFTSILIACAFKRSLFEVFQQ